MKYVRVAKILHFQHRPRRVSYFTSSAGTKTCQLLDPATINRTFNHDSIANKWNNVSRAGDSSFPSSRPLPSHPDINSVTRTYDGKNASLILRNMIMSWLRATLSRKMKFNLSTRPERSRQKGHFVCVYGASGYSEAIIPIFWVASWVEKMLIWIHQPIKMRNASD